MIRIFLMCLFIFSAALTQADQLSVNGKLPGLSIADKGELLLNGGEYSYQPWHSGSNAGQVHVLQYFAGTRAGSKTFEPLTDQLQVEFPGRGYHVTTVINLDAAMWGTGGLVVSEAKASKKEYPLSSMVLDEEGSGVQAWGVGETGVLLVVMDPQGGIIYISHAALTDSDLAVTVALIKAQMKT